jgi:dienelactone hydrolase
MRMMLSRILALLSVGLALYGSTANARDSEAAFDTVRFSSLDEQHTVLDAYLFRPSGGGRLPAVVFLHGCGGVLNSSGQINARESDWASRLNAIGYAELVVNSLTTRHHGETCSVAGSDPEIVRDRPKDAYGGLAWLQAQDFVRADRVAVMGWSQGGGGVLFTVGAQSTARPAGLPRESDFRAGVAFYPGSCNPKAQAESWTTTIPTLVLIGAEDVWTPLAPCQSFLYAAVARGANVQLQAYPGAYHDFDWPGQTVRQRPEFTTRSGVVPITGMDPTARADALQRVPAFLAQYLGR